MTRPVVHRWWRYRAPGVAAVTCMSLLFAPAVAAQLMPCPEVGNVSDMKVVLDAVYFNPPVGRSQDVFPMQRLTANLQSQLSALRTDLGAVTEVVVCATRKPSGESDFTQPQTDQYNASRVVLEVWGTVAAPSPAGGSKPRATVGFVVVPLRYYEYFQNSNAASRMSGVYLSDYSVRSSKLANLLEQSSDFKAYVTLGIGLKLLREHSFDGAKKSFCRAQYFMQPGGKTPADPAQVLLLDYARRMTAQTVSTALSTPSYQGPLKAIDPKIAAGCGQ
jgi:hypothetical protein